MKFHAILELGGKTATGITVPLSVIDALAAGKRPAVTVTLGTHTYRSTIAVMGGQYKIPVSAEHREAAGIRAGDELDVEIELDTAPRKVDVPADLADGGILGTLVRLHAAMNDLPRAGTARALGASQHEYPQAGGVVPEHEHVDHPDPNLRHQKTGSDALFWKRRLTPFFLERASDPVFLNWGGGGGL